VTVTDAGGCTGETMVEVTESEMLMPEIAGSLNICTGSTSVLFAGDFESYIWSTGSTSSEIEISSAGQYSVTVTDAGGCTGETMVEVTESEMLMPEIAGLSMICQGESTILSTGEYESYQWSNGTNTPSIEVFEAGEYFVSVTDTNGCSGASGIFVDTFPSFYIDAGEDVVLQSEKPVQLLASEAQSFLWSNGEHLSCIDCKNPIATPEETTTYFVTGLDENGCSSIDSVTIFVIVDLDLDPVNTITPNGDSMNEAFIVRGLEPFENAKLTVFNRWGDIVFDTPSYRNDWEGTFNDQPLPAGTYLYILKVQVFDRLSEQKGTITIIRD
jgi:gliding motility-associated-like protein